LPTNRLWGGSDVALADSALILSFYSGFIILPSTFVPSVALCGFASISTFCFLFSAFARVWLWTLPAFLLLPAAISAFCFLLSLGGFSFQLSAFQLSPSANF
jgi:hypothetical protein